MTLPAEALRFVVGLAVLTWGAGWLVRGASRLAAAAGVAPLVVGLTVVACGTSAPELFVSTLAALEGRGALAVGNVVGSNVLNLALIVGIGAVVSPMRAEPGLVRRDAPAMALAALSLPLLAWDGTLSRVDGAILLGAMALYLHLVVRAARRGRGGLAVDAEAGAEAVLEAEALLEGEPAEARPAADALRVVGGAAALVAGAHLMVTAAVRIAGAMGVSEVVVGIAVVAVGTSLPELATTVVAARRGESSIALGNAVGSNVFNSLLIAGAAALAAPIPVSPALFRFELPAMVAVCAAFALLLRARGALARPEGTLLLAAYAAFTAALLVRAAG